MKQKIVIQGVQGSNHHKVAQLYFGNEVQLDECLSFDDLVKSLTEERSKYAIMALENTIAGSIIPNYALIDANNIHINGEYYLNIHHHLMALPNQTIHDIQEVCSHPMALLQCKEFFKQYPHIKLVEDTDTAAVAQRIHQQQLQGIGAIATKTAAELFQLNVLSAEIQTIKTNATRFVILQKQPPQQETDQIDKASLRFELDHKRGSLATILNVMSDCKLNLTKIQSLPIIETPWKYAFFVDVTFEAYEDYAKAVSVLEIMSTSLKILGTYKNQRNQ
jgi:prephenate dehydratase